MKFFFIHLLLIYSCGQSFCQQSQYLAALSTNTESHLHDTVLAKKYIELCDNCLLENRFDSALIYADKAMILSRESGYRKGIVSVLNSYGVIKYRLSEYDKALDYFMQALKIAEEMKLEKSAALISSNIGEVLVMAKSISDMMEFGKMPLKKAADEMVMKRLPALGGDGGLIAVDKDGNIAMPFCTEGMYRGFIKSSGEKDVRIYKD